VSLSTGLIKEVPMFDSLADKIREDERQEIKNSERYIRLAGVVVISVLLFGALYAAVQFLG
jgi:hypothetical protein